jgi:hypothetical protein
METPATPVTFAVELGPGEKLTLPPSVVNSVGPGHWLVSISPLEDDATPRPVRDHSAFLNGYAPEDEGLYDDYAAR